MFYQFPGPFIFYKEIDEHQQIKEKYLPMIMEDIKVNKNKTFEVNVKFSSSSSYSFMTKFTIYKDKNGEYKIVNIIIDGINLGLTFRNQFQGVLKRESNDLDKAIQSWQPLSSEELFSS